VERVGRKEESAALLSHPMIHQRLLNIYSKKQGFGRVVERINICHWTAPRYAAEAPQKGRGALFAAILRRLPY
jgi:hypothetical protein